MVIVTKNQQQKSDNDKLTLVHLTGIEGIVLRMTEVILMDSMFPVVGVVCSGYVVAKRYMY